MEVVFQEGFALFTKLFIDLAMAIPYFMILYAFARLINFLLCLSKK